MIQWDGRVERLSKPYPIRILESALPQAGFDQLLADWPAQTEFERQVRMHGDLSDGDPGYQRLLDRSQAWRKFHDWIYSEEFARSLLQEFSGDIDNLLAGGELIVDPRTLPFDASYREGRQGRLVEVPREQGVLFSRMDIGFGLEGYGRVNGGKGIHIDNWPRLLSALVYFSDSADFDGGEFVIYSYSRSRIPFLSGRVREFDRIACRRNRGVISLQTNDAFHSVSEVKNVRRPRLAAYVALSATTGLWAPMPSEKQAKLSQSRVGRFQRNRK